MRDTPAVPLDIPCEDLQAVIDEVAARDRQAGFRLDGALAWLGWHDAEDVLRVTRAGLLDYLYYRLPTRVITDVEDQVATAGILASALEGFGDRGQAYAAICRAPQTIALIRRWDVDREGARREMSKLLDASGTRPPDLEDFRWDTVFPMTEALARDAVTTALEEAIESGAGTPGDRRWKSTAIAITQAVLAGSTDHGDPRLTRREAIDVERLERWVGREGRARRAICEPAVALFHAAEANPAPPLEPGDPGDIVVWLLGVAAGDGILLTQTHALARAVVREAVERRPDWYYSASPPNREDDVALVAELAALFQRGGLVRRRKNRWHATRQATALAHDPAAVRLTLLSRFLDAGDFSAAVGQLVLAVLLTAGPDPVDARELTTRIEPAIADDGWQTGGQPPDHWHVYGEVAYTLSVLSALDLSPAKHLDARRLVGELRAAGRPLATEALRRAATGPRGRP